MSFGSLYEVRQRRFMRERVEIGRDEPPAPICAHVASASPVFCQHRVESFCCATCKPIHSSKDQLWEFTHPRLGPIHSKGVFDRKCREQGLVRVSQDELMTRGEPTKPSLPSRWEISRRVESVIRDVKAQSANQELVERKWRETQERAAHPASPVGVEYVKEDACLKTA